MGVSALLFLGALLLLLPRRYAMVPMVLLACFIPAAQRILVFTIDFSFLRILVVVGWFRLVLRNELSDFRWNRLDTMVTAWKVIGTVVFVVAHGSLSAFIFRCGGAFDSCGLYFFFRCVLRNWKDIKLLIATFIVCSFPVAVIFCIERATGHNAFSVFGGVPATTFIRDGRLRCQGAYSHPIMAGCFWVGAIPWMVAYAREGRKWFAGAGLVAALVVVLNCASSTPVLALCFAVLGLLLYFVRAWRRVLRWGLLAALVTLHLVMEAPVWHLISRVNVVGGSTGYHRFMIMDATINNFSEWWLLGETDVMRWGVSNMRDMTNAYVVEAVQGGLITLALFVIMISVAFGMVGKSLQSCEDDRTRRFVIWCIGVSLLVHVCVFFAVTYFGKTIMMWYLSLAMIGSLPSIGMRPSPSPLPTLQDRGS